MIIQESTLVFTIYIYAKILMSKGTSCLQVTLKKFRKNIGIYSPQRQEDNANMEDSNIWVSWVKGPWEFFVSFLQVFCKSQKQPPYSELSCDYGGVGLRPRGMMPLSPSVPKPCFVRTISFPTFTTSRGVFMRVLSGPCKMKGYE